SRIALPLAIQDPRLPLGAPPVPTDRPVAADDAVAGNDEGDGICGAGTGHCAHRCGVADATGDLLVAAGRATRDLPELAPHEALESRGANVERQPSIRRAGREAVDDGADPGVEGPVGL